MKKLVITTVLAASVAVAQQTQGVPNADQNPYGNNEAEQAAQQPPPAEEAPQPAAPPHRQPRAEPQTGQRYGRPSPQNPYYAQAPIPASVTITPGTYITVRANQEVKSDRVRPGDTFLATLVQPVVASGVVVAEQGQTVVCEVVDPQDAGGRKDFGKFGLALSNITLVDGQQLPLMQSTAVDVQNNRHSAGNDVGTMATTTGIGAIVGSMIGWGTGAAIGAGVGAVAGAGILTDQHSHHTIHPEDLMTFRINAPVQISTERSTGAFHWVQPNEYNHPSYGPRRRTYVYSPAPVYYPYYSPWYGYGPYFGVTYYGGGWRHWR